MGDVFLKEDLSRKIRRSASGNLIEHKAHISEDMVASLIGMDYSFPDIDESILHTYSIDQPIQTVDFVEAFEQRGRGVSEPCVFLHKKLFCQVKRSNRIRSCSNYDAVKRAQTRKTSFIEEISVFNMLGIEPVTMDSEAIAIKIAQEAQNKGFSFPCDETESLDGEQYMNGETDGSSEGEITETSSESTDSDNYQYDGDKYLLLRSKLILFYSRHNPSRVTQVDEILTHFSGREDILYALIAQKYSIE